MVSHAQVEVPAHIARQLRGNHKFQDYARLMTGYMDSLESAASDSTSRASVEKRYKKLARQLYHLEGRQDANGDVVNTSLKTIEAITELDNYLGTNRIETDHVGDWSLVGPVVASSSYGIRGIGRVDRIAFHPTNSSIIYAGTTSGGLWRSASSGSSWGNLNSYIPSLGISGIVISHANPSTVYVLTGDGDSNLGDFGFVEGFDYIRPSIGVLKSTNEGQTWTRTNLNIPGFYVGYKLIQDPTDANTLIAATSKGLYRTDNGGSSWDLVSADSSRYYDVEWKPGSSATVYAATGNQFFMSVSAGQTWANLTNRIPVSITDGQRISLAVTPANSSYLYVLVGRTNNGTTNTKVFRSSNSAGTFFLRDELSSTEGSARYMLNIAVSPTDVNYVVTGGLRLRFSEDGALNFIRGSNIDFDDVDNYAHPDIHELNYNPLDGRLYIGTDGGVFTTIDHGINIIPRLTNMSITQYYHFDISEESTDIMMAGAQDNGIMLKNDNTAFFKNYRQGDGFDIAFPHGHGSAVLATVNKNTYFYYAWDWGSIHFSINQQNGVWFKPVAYSYFDSTKFIGGLTNVVAWRSFGNSGNSYSEYSCNARWALITSPSNNNRLYSAGGPEWNDWGTNAEKVMHRSDDKGVNWTPLHNNTGFPDTIGKITSIAVHPSNSNIVYFTLGGYQSGRKVYSSTNAGVNWLNRSSGLPNIPVNCILIHTNGDAYIGTDIGVFYRPESSLGWVPFFNGLPKVPVTELQIRGTNIYASTFGRGIWSSPLAGACPSVYAITANQSGRVMYEAGAISASCLLVNGAGTEIYMKGAESVRLSPGFRANAGTGEEYRGWIANCGTGGFILRNASLSLRNTTQAQLTGDTLNFRLPFAAEVRVYGYRNGESFAELVSEPVRLQEGPNSLVVSQPGAYQKLQLVVDGEIIAEL